MAKIKAPSKISTSVAMPRNNPLGYRRNPKGFLNPPRVQRPNLRDTRNYSKAGLPNPAPTGGGGFGGTGLTPGEEM